MTQVNSGIWRTMERQNSRIDTINTYKPPKHSKRTTGNVWHSNGSVMDNFQKQKDAKINVERELRNAFRL